MHSSPNPNPDNFAAKIAELSGLVAKHVPSDQREIENYLLGLLIKILNRIVGILLMTTA